jgi:ribonuclease VapC
MSGVVLDASALLALLLGEPGAARVAAALDEAVIGAVNHAEVVGHYARLGATAQEIGAMLSPLALRVIEADADLAFEAGMLRPLTEAAGLSLGDRFCLALARRRDVPALTADRAWLGLEAAAGVRIEQLRG